jgi:hypothetical protein
VQRRLCQRNGFCRRAGDWHTFISLPMVCLTKAAISNSVINPANSQAVINYDAPLNAMTCAPLHPHCSTRRRAQCCLRHRYVHRSGRTARAGREGTCIR